MTELEERILSLTAHKPQGRFLQIGAAYSTADNEPCWNLLGKGWHGIFVEPNPRNSHGLMTTLIEQGYENQFTVYNLAIADTTGIRKFYMPRHYESCSSLRADWLEKMAFLENQDPGPVDTVYVLTTTLNDLFRSTGTDIDLISIDIEIDDIALEYTDPNVTVLGRGYI